MNLSLLFVGEIVVSDEVQHAVNHHAQQLCFTRNIKIFGIVAHPIVADEHISTHIFILDIIESDDIGVVVVAEILFVHVPKILVGAENIRQVSRETMLVLHGVVNPILQRLHVGKGEIDIFKVKINVHCALALQIKIHVDQGAALKKLHPIAEFTNEIHSPAAKLLDVFGQRGVVEIVIIKAETFVLDGENELSVVYLGIDENILGEVALVAVTDGIGGSLQRSDEYVAVQVLGDVVLRAQLVDEILNDLYVFDVRCNCNKRFHTIQISLSFAYNRCKYSDKTN